MAPVFIEFTVQNMHLFYYSMQIEQVHAVCVHHTVFVHALFGITSITDSCVMSKPFSLSDWVLI